MMHVRDLRAEDLAGLLCDSPPARVRFLVEAGDALARCGEGDVVAISDAERTLAVAAAVYEEPFGEATIVLAPMHGGIEDVRRLLADLEARSAARHCLGLVGAVDAPDLAARRVLESLGYELSGAGVVVWTEESGPGAVERQVDVWRLRKAISEGGGTLPPATEPRRGSPPMTRDEEDTCSSD